MDSRGDKMKVLVIYPEIPESTRLFVIDNLSEEELMVLNDANGAFVNSTKMKKNQEMATSWVTAAVANPKYKKDWGTQPFQHIVGKWHSKEINSKQLPEVTGIEKVFITGFIL
jgi:hypothetical protein